MKWVTREHPKVDRIACPWLIKRMVDPEAQFLYVASEQVLATAEREGATAFDAPGVELGHRGDECSFDAVMRKYDLAKNDPALEPLARIVRGADTAQHELTPESRGLLAIANGFSATTTTITPSLQRSCPSMTPCTPGVKRSRLGNHRGRRPGRKRPWQPALAVIQRDQ
jgi:hypothetical protein